MPSGSSSCSSGVEPGQSAGCYPTADQVALVAEQFDGKRVALVHEWISEPLAGSEKVFQAICRLFSECDTEQVALFDERGAVSTDPGPVSESFLANRAFCRWTKAARLPAMPLAWAQLRRKHPADVAVISSHALASQFARHVPYSIVYCHSPIRYAWLPEIDRRSRLSGSIRPALAALRQTDRSGARHVNAFLANSAEVKTRIDACYGRSSRVVYPPVDTDYFQPDAAVDRDIPLLSVGRMVDYKRHDLALDVAHRLGISVTIAGSGPKLSDLRDLARRLGVDASFVESPTDADLRRLCQRGRVLMHGGIEDFGIVPVEAIACGTPVVALDTGGTSETVSERAGLLVQEQTSASFGDAVATALSRDWEPAVLHSQATRFSYPAFYASMTIALTRATTAAASA